MLRELDQTLLWCADQFVLWLWNRFEIKRNSLIYLTGYAIGLLSVIWGGLIGVVIGVVHLFASKSWNLQFREHAREQEVHVGIRLSYICMVPFYVVVLFVDTRLLHEHVSAVIKITTTVTILLCIVWSYLTYAKTPRNPPKRKEKRTSVPKMAALGSA